MRLARALVLAMCALALACAQRERVVTPGQVVLHVDTDAPVPAALGQPASLAAPLFDRLRVDIFPPGAAAPCAGCTNEFEIDAALFTANQVSFGFAPPFGVSGYRARIRLFKTSFADPSGEPDKDSTVDVTVALPVVDADVIVDASVVLSTETVGTRVGSLDAPAPTTPGAPKGSLVGTWSGAARVDCAKAPPPGAVCVPGGAYWMGNPRAPGFNPRSYAPEPRLVVLSPFFMAATEVVVQDFRASGRTPKESWTGQSSGITSQSRGSTPRPWC